MPSFSTRTIGSPDGDDNEERRRVLEHFTERSTGWDCGRCASHVNGKPLFGPLKHLEWHEAIGG